MKNYYQILEINESASEEVIKAAYKALVKKYHPDNYGSSDKIQYINEAFEVLSDAEKRRGYDDRLKQGSGNSSYEPYKERTSSSQEKDTEEAAHAETEKEKENHAVQENGVFKVLKKIGKELVGSFYHQIEKYNKDESDAYIHGCTISDADLVRKFKNSLGAQRNGYAKALEERGFLYKDEGKYKPTSKFKIYK